jgi:hypothetical protein
MKTKIHTIRVVTWIILGVAILSTNLAFFRNSTLGQETTATPTLQTSTTATKSQARDEAGSTDGIMVMAVVIVLVVIVPILLKRWAWENGKRNKTTPPS